MAIIKSVENGCEAVQSRLLDDLMVSAQNQPGFDSGLNGAQHGSLSVDVSNLQKPGDSSSPIIAYYSPQQVPMFSRPPSVIVTVTGSEPYVCAVSNVTTSQFTLILTAVQTCVAPPVSVLVNWLALASA
jgi:hypothetical protein